MGNQDFKTKTKLTSLKWRAEMRGYEIKWGGGEQMGARVSEGVRTGLKEAGCVGEEVGERGSGVG